LKLTQICNSIPYPNKYISFIQIYYFIKHFTCLTLGISAKFQKGTITSVIYACLSSCTSPSNNLAPTGWITMKF